MPSVGVRLRDDGARSGGHSRRHARDANSTSSGQIFERFSLLPVDNIVRITSYLRDASYAEANAQARVAALGGRLIPTTAIVAETLEADWLVEIEVIAAA